MKPKSLCWARVAKNIAYFLVPVFGIMLIASIVGLSIMDADIRLKNAENYYETKLFSEQYLNQIYKNYYETTYNTTYYEYDGSQVKLHVNEKNENPITYYSNNNTNFYYLIVNTKNNEVVTNVTHTMRTDSIEGIKQELAGNAVYWNYENGKVQTSITNLKLEDIRYTFEFESLMKEDVNIYTILLDDLPYSDSYSISKAGYDLAIKANDLAPILIPISAVCLSICAVIILRGIGRVAKQEQIYLNWLDKWKLEIVLLIGLIIIAIGSLFFIAIKSRIRTLMITGGLVGSIIIYLAGILMLETLVKRLKTHTTIKSTILYSICHGIKQVIDSRKMTTKLSLLYWGFCILGFWFTAVMVTQSDSSAAMWALLLFILGVATYWYLFKKRKQFDEIQQALKSIYEGNTNIDLDSSQMQGVLKQLAVYVEDIAGGLSNAVNESLKSERLKTELITNVSHDIKTPLTSIINYVDLLKKEKMPNEKCSEYLMILENKSQRLKKLTEDLVEASKASSGNIKLKMEKINVGELVKQVSGEFEDKFKARQLEEIITIPEKPIFIKADGRYMYRVLENMYSNAAKYAMENTRIYMDVIEQQTSVVIQMKNISQEKLNISAEELMQRFVRGDSSRNTEGSGLGLSIASSLTGLQEGKFHIYLDGDLFKITIGFEKYK